jgi:hypothetical protein
VTALHKFVDLKYIDKNTISPRIYNKLKKLFIGQRHNFLIFNNKFKKDVLKTQLKILRNLAFSKQKILILTEYFELFKLKHRVNLPRPKTKNIYKYVNEWSPGSILRFFSRFKKKRRKRKLKFLVKKKKKINKNRVKKPKFIVIGATRFEKKVKKKRIKIKFPSIVINISKKERLISILESKRLNILTFSFTDINKKSFLKSDFKYPIKFFTLICFEYTLALIYANILYSKIYYDKITKLFFKNITKNILTIKKPKYKYITIFNITGRKIQKKIQKIFNRIKARKFNKRRRRRKLTMNKMRWHIRRRLWWKKRKLRWQKRKLLWKKRRNTKHASPIIKKLPIKQKNLPREPIKRHKIILYSGYHFKIFIKRKRINKRRLLKMYFGTITTQNKLIRRHNLKFQINKLISNKYLKLKAKMIYTNENNDETDK